MKKLSLFLFICIAMLSIAACGNAGSADAPSEAVTDADVSQAPAAESTAEPTPTAESATDVEPTPAAESTPAEQPPAATENPAGTENSAATETVATTENTAVFNFETRTVLLNSGYEMPILGLGTFRLSDSECENSVYHAMLDGFRLIDTARIYGNEAAVGRGIVRSGVLREEIFITTKIWTADFSDAANAIDASLERLGVEYIDLMLLHHSGPNDEDAYRAMEEAVASGKIRSIGISNFYEEDFERIMEMATITPAVVQNETHPYNQSASMKEFLRQYGTVMESWFPLGGRGNTQVLFDDETISSIAAAHGKTSAQVILRWHLQAGNIAIPGSSNPDHIEENYNIFDFELSADEMARMTALDRQTRFADY